MFNSPLLFSSQIECCLITKSTGRDFTASLNTVTNFLHILLHILLESGAEAALACFITSLISLQDGCLMFCMFNFIHLPDQEEILCRSHPVKRFSDHSQCCSETHIFPFVFNEIPHGPTESEPGSTFWSLQSASCCCCQSHLPAI